MSTPVGSSSLGHKQTSLSPLQSPQRCSDDPVTEAANERLVKKPRTSSLEPSPLPGRVGIYYTPTYFIYQFEQHIIPLIQSAKTSTAIEIDKQGYQILEEAISHYYGEETINTLIGTFTKGTTYCAPNTAIAKALFLFGASRHVRFEPKPLNTLRSTGFGLSSTPHLTIQSLSSDLSAGNSIECKLLDRASIFTLVHLLETDKTITDLTIRAVTSLNRHIVRPHRAILTQPLQFSEIPSLFNTLTRCSQLSSLTIKYGDLGSIHAARAIATHINISSYLHRLHLEYSNLSIEGVTEIITAMITNTSITSFTLMGFEGAIDANHKIINGLEQSIAGMLQCNTTLTDLDFSEGEFSQLGRVITKNLRGNSSLTSLTLRNHRAKNVSKIFKLLTPNTVLSRLKLNGVGVDTHTLGALIGCLQVNTTLTDITLTPNAGMGMLSDEQGENLAQIILRSSTLQKLDIDGVTMSDEAAKRIAQALWFNRSVTKFHFSQIKHLRLFDIVATAILEALRVNGSLTAVTYRGHHPGSAREPAEDERIKSASERAEANAFQKNVSLFELLFAKIRL